MASFCVRALGNGGHDARSIEISCRFVPGTLRACYQGLRFRNIFLHFHPSTSATILDRQLYINHDRLVESLSTLTPARGHDAGVDNRCRLWDALGF